MTDDGSKLAKRLALDLADRQLASKKVRAEVLHMLIAKYVDLHPDEQEGGDSGRGGDLSSFGAHRLGRAPPSYCSQIDFAAFA